MKRYGWLLIIGSLIGATLVVAQMTVQQGGQSPVAAAWQMLVNGGTLSSAGNVTISGTPSVAISGTPSVNATITGTPSITGAVSITGTPSVSISGTPSVALSGSWPYSGALGSINVTGGTLSSAGTISVSGGTLSSVGTASVTGTVSITGVPSVTATISGVPAVTATLSGTPAVTATISGTPAVTATLSGNAVGTPYYTRLSDGTNAMGTMSAFGTSPSAVNAINSNGSLFLGTTAAATASAGVLKVGVVGNAGAAFDAAIGGTPPANTLQIGGLASGATAGLMKALTVCDSDYVINIGTASTVLVTAGTTSRLIHICSMNMVVSAADNVALIEGTGATCGTGSAGVAGGSTSATGWPFGANGGLTLGSGLGEVMTTATTGDSLCIISWTASVQVSGHIKYTIF